VFGPQPASKAARLSELKASRPVKEERCKTGAELEWRAHGEDMVVSQNKVK